MLKKVNFVLIAVLAFVLLVGCHEEESSLDPGINVRIIEGFDVHGSEILPYFRSIRGIWGEGSYIQVLNGLTGEIENIIEFNEYRRFHNWHFPQPYGDYYIVLISLFDGYEPDTAQQIDIEYYIFDQEFNLVEEFTITPWSEAWLRVGSPMPQTMRQNEAGEWLGYTINLDGEISTYNFHTNDIIQIAHLNDFSFLWDLFLMPDVNKLAFMLADEFGFYEPTHVEFGFMDLDKHEITMVHEAESIMPPHQFLSFQPIAPRGEVWLHNLSGFDTQEREVLTIDSLTGEVRTFPIREDDFTWRGDESYFRWISDASITRDGKWLLMQASEEGELVEGWCMSNTTKQIRLYDVETGDVIFEHLLIDEDTLSLGEWLSSDASIIQLEENIYLIRQSISTGLTEETFFAPTGIRFEYIVIEIVVNDDE